MIENPDQIETVSMPRRDWLKVAVAVAFRTESDQRLQPIFEHLHEVTQSWETNSEPSDSGSES